MNLRQKVEEGQRWTIQATNTQTKQQERFEIEVMGLAVADVPGKRGVMIETATIKFANGAMDTIAIGALRIVGDLVE